MCSKCYLLCVSGKLCILGVIERYVARCCFAATEGLRFVVCVGVSQLFRRIECQEEQISLLRVNWTNSNSVGWLN